MALLESCYCYAKWLETAKNSLKILEVHWSLKSENVLVIKHFLRFREYSTKPAITFPKP